jgi:transcriptional regulator with XRE-family HTH domain
LLRRPATLLLRQHRALLSLTLEEVAAELGRLAWALNGVHVGVNADMVGKWERGEKRPSKLYRQLLCLLYECSAEKLGLWEPGGSSELRRAGGLVVPPPGLGGRWPERPLHVSEAPSTTWRA